MSQIENGKNSERNGRLIPKDSEEYWELMIKLAKAGEELPRTVLNELVERDPQNVTGNNEKKQR